ncbi:MAG: hypothetical protein C4329_06545 [Chitinophagaceae bacterium]
MKKLLLATFLFPSLTFAQDCKLNKTTDPYTKQVKLSTGFFPLTSGGNKVSMSIDIDPKEINFLFFFPNAGESKCFDDASSAIAIYEGERYRNNFKNTGAMNCEGYFQMSFRNLPVTPSNLDKLSTKKLSTIRFIGNKKDTTTVILTDEQKLKLMSMVGCAIKESKSLLPPQ